MKPLIVLVLGACLGFSAAVPADLSSVHKVYLMPMGGGLDQYLAERLTTDAVFTVVVDPKQADAVLSERVDPAFVETLNELYPPPKPAAEKEKKEAGAIQKPEQPLKRSFGQARGNVFLVSVASRQVLWSTYLKTEDRSSSGLHRAARDIVKQLKKELAGKE